MHGDDVHVRPHGHASTRRSSCAFNPLVQAWQDEEWQPQDNHRELGIAVGKVRAAPSSQSHLAKCLQHHLWNMYTGCPCVSAGLQESPCDRGERLGDDLAQHCHRPGGV